MQNLAAETLIHIFRLACTDGGYTGCSLSQTSRAVRDVSHPIRFFSVALAIDHVRLESFLASYQTLGALAGGTKVKINHLLLEDPREKQEAPDERSSFQVGRLLDLVAADLESLVLPSMFTMSPDTITLPDPDESHTMTMSPADQLQVGARPFASLRALTVDVTRDLSVATLEAFAAVSESPLFPALTHLHLVMAPGSYSVGPFSPWERHAPHTTHLRISHCPLLGPALEDVRLLLGTPSYPHQMGRRPVPVHSPPSARRWPTLRRIVIQPLPAPPFYTRSGLSGTAGVFYWNLRSELSWKAEWATREGGVDVRVIEAVRAERAAGEARARVRRAWERLVSCGVDSDWLTWGESEEDEGSHE